MGMHVNTYVIMGIKKTRQEWNDCGIDYGYIEEGNPGISAVWGEDNNDVVIGKILAKTNEYSDQIATELVIPSVHRLSWQLSAAGIQNNVDDIKIYAFAVWI